MFKLICIIIGIALMYSIYRSAKESNDGDDDYMGGYPQN